jgi:hypothetical protein
MGNWINNLANMVQRYSGEGSGAASAPENPHEDYQQVVQNAPPDVVAGGLSHAFRSDQTPAFPEMTSNLYTHSDPNQRAGLLNRLIGALGPGALNGIPGLSGLSGLLSGGQVTPQQASQVRPEQVQEIAAHAEQRNPSVVDQVSGFYAQHPQVVKALGGLALTVALQHMMRRR